MENQLRETSVSTIWDDLGRFRPFDVPLLFPNSEREFGRKPQPNQGLVTPDSPEEKTYGASGCRTGQPRVHFWPRPRLNTESAKSVTPNQQFEALVASPVGVSDGGFAEGVIDLFEVLRSLAR